MRLWALALVLPACGGVADLRRGVTTLTSGDPRPGAAPNPSRAIDNTGFVDNGGRTSEQWGRGDLSGARATELGGSSPTFTNTGVPNGADLGRGADRGGRGVFSPPSFPPSGPANAAERAEVMPSAGGSPIADEADVNGRIARAACDHETSCGRVADGRAWKSQDVCMADFRARADAELGRNACVLDEAAVATCLATIRARPCGQPLERIDELTACRRAALCAP